MTKGNLAIVLHAHLPYVRAEEPGSLEEDWFFQALAECYLPLLETLENASRSKDQAPKNHNRIISYFAFAFGR